MKSVVCGTIVCVVNGILLGRINKLPFKPANNSVEYFLIAYDIFTEIYLAVDPKRHPRPDLVFT